jgi:integrase
MARPRTDGTPSTASNKQRLSHFAVKNLQPKERPYSVWDVVQRGLAITVQPSGSTAWKCVYTFRGRKRWMHLADATAIGLADARKLANEIMYQVAQGKDPAAERRAERSADTFEDLAIRYRKYAEKRNKSWRQADRLITRYLLPKWAKLPAATITRADVKVLIASVDAPILSNQILASASAVFSWSIKQDIAGITVNPCFGVERNVTVSRERILSDAELPLFWSAFDAAGIHGAALQAILILGQRPGEVCAMRSDHIVDGWWSLPGEVVSSLGWPGTKNKMSHRVWLPAPVQQIIASMGNTGRVFDGVEVPYLGVTMRTICTALGVERLTCHDLRRSNGTLICALGFGRDAMNRIQNHKEGGIASVYDRHGYADENRKVMEAVAARIGQLIGGGPDNVLAFKRAT